MSLFEGARTKVKVVTQLSEEFEVNVGRTSEISFVNTVSFFLSLRLIPKSL